MVHFKHCKERVRQLDNQQLAKMEDYTVNYFLPAQEYGGAAPYSYDEHEEQSD